MIPQLIDKHHIISLTSRCIKYTFQDFQAQAHFVMIFTITMSTFDE